MPCHCNLSRHPVVGRDLCASSLRASAAVSVARTTTMTATRSRSGAASSLNDKCRRGRLRNPMLLYQPLAVSAIGRQIPATHLLRIQQTSHVVALGCKIRGNANTRNRRRRSERRRSERKKRRGGRSGNAIGRKRRRSFRTRREGDKMTTQTAVADAQRAKISLLTLSQRRFL